MRKTDVRTLMLDFQVPRITSESIDDNRGSFTIEPLDRGFGYTFGNSLRRVLLSSLAGAAVTSVRIEGVAHEFSTIKGVTEDVTDIVLNLKGVVCRMHSDASEIEAPLVVTGPGVPHGYVMSPSVKRLGVVTVTDMAPTILDAMGGTVPDGMIGHGFEYHAGNVDLSSLRRLDRDAGFR